MQDFAAALSPGLLMLKHKFHILSHLPDHILRFGPALLFSTERYESFNRIFRLCSIHSNRQAPSRDIAITFANQDRCRHILTGGFWYDASQRGWVCASPAVRLHLQTCERDARLLGIHMDKAPSPGTMLFSPAPSAGSGSSHNPRTHAVMAWSATKASGLGSTEIPPRLGLWRAAKSLVTVSGDIALVGSEVLVHAQQQV